MDTVYIHQVNIQRTVSRYFTLADICRRYVAGMSSTFVADKYRQ